MENKGMQVFLSNAPGFNHIEFTKRISKPVYMNHLDTTNFQISQMKCNMCMLHWVVLNILYRKPSN